MNRLHRLGRSFGKEHLDHGKGCLGLADFADSHGIRQGPGSRGEGQLGANG